ncbi:MAG: hypothetical protein PHT13_00235 [Methanosarcina sp.]|nr:hypothetical protein [Methanosarcina sp.]
MTFVSKTWVTDEIIFETDMNRMEVGISDAHDGILDHAVLNSAHGSLGRILGAGEIGVPNGLAGLNDYGAMEIETSDLPQFIGISDEGLGGSLRGNGTNGLEILSNAYYIDGVWRRFVNAYGALALVMDPMSASFKMLMVAAGTEDFTEWDSLFEFDDSGNLTISGELTTETLMVNSSIYSLDGLSADTVASRSNLSILDGSLLKMFNTGSSNYIGFSAPATLAADYSLVLPEETGAEGKALITDGAGNLSWGDAGGVSITVGNVDGGRADTVYSADGFILYGGSATE